MMLFAHFWISGLQRVNKHIAITSIVQPSSAIHRGSCMSAHVLMNLSKGLGKRDKYEACRKFYLFLATSFINSIKLEHKY